MSHRVRYEVAPLARRDRRAGYAGNWKLTREGTIVATFHRKREAVEQGTCIVRIAAEQQDQLCTLKIKGCDGRIREERTYPRSSDPTSTKG
jgi:hypothetical protein